MRYHNLDLREIVGMVLCAVLSAMAFLGILIFVSYNFGDRWVALLGMMIGLVCPVVWLALLLWQGGGGGGLLRRVKSSMKRPQPAMRRTEQPAVVPIGGTAIRRLLPLP